MAPPVKAELRYNTLMSKLSKYVFFAKENTVKEGFEYFQSKEYTSKNPDQKMSIKTILFANGFSHFWGMIKIMGKYMKSMMKGRKECFTDLDNYIKEIEEKGKIEVTNNLSNTFPNNDIWTDIEQYAWKKWKVKIGFTELDEELIFKGKGVLFKYCITCMQEMDKTQIDKAPKLDAGQEVQKVYNSLGLAVNDIARYMRKKFDIKCQSNHPLGGVVNTAPLFGKAGMGWQGLDGLLITPEFGKRQRTAPIFIQEKYFEYTDNKKHQWIEEYCKKCRKCEKSCPTGAINHEKIVKQELSSGIRVKTCIDREKCFPQFTKTLGCSICIKVCPFSKGNGIYDKIFKAFSKKIR